MVESDLTVFDWVLTVVVPVLLLAFVGSGNGSGESGSASHASGDVTSAARIRELTEAIARLQAQLRQQEESMQEDFRQMTFECLQSLLTSYPSVVKMAKANPELPASNLVAIFSPLENLLTRWGCASIGNPWEQVPFDPQYHQADEAIAPGEPVYIRFVGYRHGEQILYPATVSRTLPPSALPAAE
jgi:molecular chaperone GrpE (heat shock protein)